ncbi:hypothetical protein AGLY_014775 [Aphis glycines]|uniref:Uncharacterized protein n=1 Tax=Aphis glycines TaxID=307491 RepID=A0A6G0T305_APHGL|nr:hypothetical protein AGLY_014775 [Aphis glycines]
MLMSVVSFKFLRNLSKTRKFAILKIWYKVLHKFFFKYLQLKFSIFLKNFFDPIKILVNFIQSSSYFKFCQKFVKIMKICKLFCNSKFIKLFVFISNVKKFNTKFSVSFASKSYRENFKLHYRKNVLSTDKSSPFRIYIVSNRIGRYSKKMMRLELAPSAQMLRVYEWLDSGP